MTWEIILHDDFDPEFDRLEKPVRNALLARMGMLEISGPGLGRPIVDTLKGGRHSNLKELRFNANGGVWRFAFAFDPERQAIILCGGDKAGEDQTKFYEWLISLADDRFAGHLAKLKGK